MLSALSFLSSFTNITQSTIGFILGLYLSYFFGPCFGPIFIGHVLGQLEYDVNRKKRKSLARVTIESPWTQCNSRPSRMHK